MILGLSKRLNPWQILWAIVGLGMAIRFLALPFAHTTENDALARVYMAWEWLKDPKLITHGIWLPLQTYYMALVLALTQEFYYTPIISNIAFSIFTAIPLYWFSRREFSKNAGWFVALAFLLYPLAFRNSLMVLSDTPFAFFVAVTLLLLSYARCQTGKLWHVSLAGLMLSLAAALRYEAWVLIPFMGLVLWRKPKFMLCFWVVAMIVPGLWMLGSIVAHGDPFYSFHYQALDTAKNFAERGGLSWRNRLVRLLFFPGVLFFGLSGIVFCLAIWGMGRSIRLRQPQAIWLIPCFGLLAVLLYKSLSGTMNLQPRYALVPGMFLLPFATIALHQIQHRKQRSFLTWAALLLMIPSSYSLNILQPVVQSLLSNTKMMKKESPGTLIEAVPRLASSTQTLSQIINSSLRSQQDGLVVIGFSDITHLLAYEAKLNPDRVYAYYQLDEEKRQKLATFLAQHPQGILALDRLNWPSNMLSRPVGQRASLANGQKLQLLLIHTEDEGAVYRYQLLQPNHSTQ
jgi:4-amino-4-deoxy-L-arabinose transferase-like glycosyltransferase